MEQPALNNVEINSELQKLTFEESLQRLELIVRNLESGNLTLDEALLKFQEGIQVSRICHLRLEEAERKIDLLVSGNDGKITLKPAQFAENGEE